MYLFQKSKQLYKILKQKYQKYFNINKIYFTYLAVLQWLVPIQLRDISTVHKKSKEHPRKISHKIYSEYFTRENNTKNTHTRNILKKKSAWSIRRIHCSLTFAYMRIYNVGSSSGVEIPPRGEFLPNLLGGLLIPFLLRFCVVLEHRWWWCSIGCEIRKQRPGFEGTKVGVRVIIRIGTSCFF